MKNKTVAYYLNPQEIEVISRLTYEKTTIITLSQFDNYFRFPSTVRNKILWKLKKKGILVSIKKGLYIFSPLENGPAGRNINEWLIPCSLFPNNNYYVGYSQMYNYYGFTDQIFQQMFIINTSTQSERKIGKIQFNLIKVSPDRMYGLKSIKVKEAEVIVSDKERTLVDLVYYPKPVGGLQKAFEILDYQVKSKFIDLKKLIKYASLFPIISTRKRIGFILEKAGVDLMELKPVLKKVEGTSLTTLYDGNSRKGKINKRWGIIENAS